MRKQAIFVLGLLLAFSSIGLAQTKTVTNADLAKFRQKRLQAENDLRENYRALGFPSPEELDRQTEEEKKRLFELSERLRRERMQNANLEIERERLAAEREYRQANDSSNSDSAQGEFPYPNPNFVDYSQYGATTYVYPSFWRYPRFYRNPNRNFGGFGNFRQSEFFRNRRGGTAMRPAFRGDIRLNRLQRLQNQRGNRRVFPGVGVVRSIRGN